MSTPTTGLAHFAGERHIRLSTYARDGAPVAGTTQIAVEGDHAYVRTSGRDEQNERLERYPEVEITPATLGGTPTGAPLKAHARRLHGAEARHAARRLARRHPLMQGLAAPLGCALKLDRPVLYELRLPGD
ncbi:hypothetical protein WDH52_17595 [Streptomyces sp. TRM70308]|uniref:hypothetical protein n=1 Tax=Streptomyces TaxID=1883 RepID=UPI002249405B|nr:hypothetical protein [Streptomyces sp. JHD 1]MCX2968767.1 hypothetical protein [Streptomyces sp. JHD 1]